MVGPRRLPEQGASRQVRQVQEGASGARHQVGGQVGGHQVEGHQVEGQVGIPTKRVQVSAGVHRQAPLPHQRCALDPSRLRHLNPINLRRTHEVLARLHLLRQLVAGSGLGVGPSTTT